jgi:anti-sigma factor RsiW
MAITMSKAMNSETEILSEADEIAAMLPWYVTGKLSAADTARVDAYVTSHPEVNAHLALARDEADGVFADNASITAPRGGLDRLQKSLASSPAARMHAAKSSFIDRVGEWLGGFTPRQLAYAGLTAALVLAVQTASIGSLISKPSGSIGYETASGPGTSLTNGSFALVAFQPAAPTGTLSAFLADNRFAVVDGPKTGGVYRVRLSETVMASKDLEAAVAKLKARTDLVSFASSAGSSP